MKRVITGVVLSVLALFSVGYSLVENPHRFSADECMRCHLTDPGAEKAPVPLVAPESELCRDCHSGMDALLTHPVEIRPRHAEVPADMPLSTEGKLTCSTCHDIHSSYRTPFGAPSHFLRRQVSGRRFCIICHREKNAEVATDHSGILNKAHFKPRYHITDNTRAVDSVSAECLSCHDGSVARLSVIGVGSWSHAEGFTNSDTGTHPIGVDYEDVYMNSPGEFRPPSMLDSRIKLVDGKVGCVSCHNLYSDTPMKLVMSNRQSRLCLECHIK